MPAMPEQFPSDPQDVAAAALWLMATDSTSGREQELVAALATVLTRRGWEVSLLPVNGGRHDLLATSGAGPFVTLSTHLDTVPPYIPPRREGGRLWGRGACDAKGIAAAMLVAGESLRAERTAVALLFVVGEETSHDGAHAADAWCRRTAFPSRALVNGEPTEGCLARGSKGALRATVRVRGEAAHSAYPERGRSATRELVMLLAELDGLDLPRDDVLGDTTVNIGQLSGGVADNVLAPTAEARLMVRLVTDAADVWTRLERWCAGRATLERGVQVPPVRLATLPGFPTTVVSFATDIPALPAWGVPYLYGPGSIHVAHRDDEHVEVAELERAVREYQWLVRSV